MRRIKAEAELEFSPLPHKGTHKLHNFECYNWEEEEKVNFLSMYKMITNEEKKTRWIYKKYI